MFYEKLYGLCVKKGTNVTEVLKALNLSTSKGTAWKNGATPNLETASKLAMHLGVSVDYFSEIPIEKIVLKNILSLLDGVTDYTHIANAIGVNVHTILTWVKGVSPSYMDHIPKIAAYLNVSPEYLLGNEPKESNISFDDFTFAMHEETKDLTGEQKTTLLAMAKAFKEHLDKK